MKRNLALSLLTAAFAALAFPPFRTGFIAWFGLLPFFLLLNGKTVRETLRWSYLTGLFICITTLYWIGFVTQAGLLGAILIIPLYLTLYGLIHVVLLRRIGRKAWLLLPFIWLSIEYLQSISELAFPWNYLGYTQSYYLPLIQYAEYSGIWGVSFWVFCLNALIWAFWRESESRRQKRLAGILLAALLLLPFLQGIWAMHGSPKPARFIKVAMLQGNVDPFEKWEAGSTEKNIELYETMTREAAAQKPALIVWPETAMPFYLRSEAKYLLRVQSLVDSIGIPVITGTLDYNYTSDSDYDYYNAATLIEPQTRFLQVYHKMRLVPGSERIPYREYFPFKYAKNWLDDLALGVGDYARGDAFTVFRISAGPKTASVAFSTPICYESVFPDLDRRFAAQGVDMLCIITNDAWFGRTSAPYQHSQFAVFRAIENRVPIARCANTGISCFIDACGRVTQRTALFQKRIITGSLSLRREKTFYTRHGDWFAHLCMVASGAGLLFAGLIHLRRGKKNNAQS
jgi:apolipoprotein N-acyltransferase